MTISKAFSAELKRICERGRSQTYIPRRSVKIENTWGIYRCTLPLSIPIKVGFNFSTREEAKDFRDKYFKVKKDDEGIIYYDIYKETEKIDVFKNSKPLIQED